MSSLLVFYIYIYIYKKNTNEHEIIKDRGLKHERVTDFSGRDRLLS